MTSSRSRRQKVPSLLAFPRGALALAALAAATAWAAPAAAALTLITPPEREAPRDSNENPHYISYNDCLTDVVMTFEGTADLADLDGFSVWVAPGTDIDCTDPEQRTLSCKNIQDVTLTETNFTVEVSTKKIATSLAGVDAECVDSGSGTTARAATLYFLLFTGGLTTITEGNFAVWSESKVDLLGPSPPTELEVQIGEENLTVAFKPATDADLLGYYVFADPLGGGGGAGGGGAGGGGGEAPAVCASALLVEGEIVASGSTLNKGKAAKAATDVTADDLVNDVTYALAVAGYDDVGNAGRLSEVVCAAPAEVDDFFETYRNAGGQAGGGFCALQGVGAPIGAGAAMTGLAVAALLARRRSRKPGASSASRGDRS